MAEAARRLSVTVIDGDIAYPPSNGKRLRTLNLLLPLAHRHRITYISRCHANEADAAREFLSSHGIQPILVVDPVAPKTGLAFYARLATNLLSPLPYSVTSHYSAAMREVVQRHAAAGHTDVWQLEWLGYGYCLDDAQRPRILQAHNVEALIWQRHRETETRLLHRLYITQQWRKFLRFERSAMQSATTVVCVSDADAAMARNLYGFGVPTSAQRASRPSIAVVDNGVDTGYFAGVAPEEGSRTILFLGALDWRPNQDALQVLIDDIMPLVRRRIPDSRLAVVGRKPSEEVRRRISRADGVTLHADVADVRPFMRQAAAMSVPLRIGGGSRLKILEALAASLPVVSSTIGAEGLNIESGRHFKVADTAEAHASALVECIEHPSLNRARAAAGRDFVRGNYEWSDLATRLERIWLDAAGEKPSNVNPILAQAY